MKAAVGIDNLNNNDKALNLLRQLQWIQTLTAFRRKRPFCAIV
jgi:hypothetical protein